ncbi:hypothetical protein HD806DRAFT_530042 [Xylariaceae sp. AK1471]|nr:hypothetical protein HD806DRAFT_530042 [Xylariaceae sp. AK1471]
MNETSVRKAYTEHYDYFSGRGPELVGMIRNTAEFQPDAIFVFVAMSVTHKHVGVAPSANSVNPTWRNALMLLNFSRELTPDASWADIRDQQAKGTWGNSEWKSDYFGTNYNRLARVKAKYDPNYRKDT